MASVLAPEIYNSTHFAIITSLQQVQCQLFKEHIAHTGHGGVYIAMAFLNCILTFCLNLSCIFEY